MRKDSGKAAFKKSVNLFLFLLLLSTILVFINFSQKMRQFEKQAGTVLHHLAIEMGQRISAQEHRTIKSAKDAQSESFRRIRQQIRRFAKKHSWQPDYIYTYQFGDDTWRKFLTTREDKESDTTSVDIAEHFVDFFDLGKKGKQKNEIALRYAVMTHEEPFVNGISMVPFRLHQSFAMLSENNIVVTPRYGDQHGEWITGLSLIKDNAGQVGGLVAVDYRLNGDQQIFIEQAEKMISVITVLLLLVSLIFYRKYAEYLRWFGALSKVSEDGEFVGAEKKLLQRVSKYKDHRGVITRLSLSLAERLRSMSNLNSYLSPFIRKKAEDRKIRHNLEMEVEENNMAVLVLYMGLVRKTTPSFDNTKMIRVINRVHLDFTQSVLAVKGIMERATGSLLIAYFQGPNCALNAARAGSKTLVVLEKYWESSMGRTDQEEGMSPSPQTADQENTPQIAPQGLKAWQGVRLGISCGPIIVGGVRNKIQRDIVHLGDDMEIAIRMAMQADPFEIIFSDSVFNEIFDYSHLPQGYHIVHKGEGKTVFRPKPMKLYSITRISEQAGES